jgi:hypothetical protein
MFHSGVKFTRLATGDIRFNISQESLANIEIEIPDTHPKRNRPNPYSLDDKIELNLQMNQTLKQWHKPFLKSGL